MMTMTCPYCHECELDGRYCDFCGLIVPRAVIDAYQVEFHAEVARLCQRREEEALAGG